MAKQRQLTFTYVLKYEKQINWQVKKKNSQLWHSSQLPKTYFKIFHRNMTTYIVQTKMQHI